MSASAFRYSAMVASGEALGIAAVALAYAAASRGYVAEAPAILAAGAWEGLCLGTAQAIGMRHRAVPVRRFVAATISMAVLGYAGSLGAMAGGEVSDAEPDFILMAAGTVLLGAAMGLLMGGVQAFAAGGALPWRSWITRTTLGWSVAMPVIFAGSAVVSGTTPLWSVALTGALAGALAGVAIGIATAAVAVMRS